MRPTASVQTTDKLAQLKKDLARLAGDRVLIGIPESNADRGENSIGPRLRSGAFNSRDRINNAALLFIHTNGSPLRKLPARPVIEPAILAPDNLKRITDALGRAAESELAGDQAQVLVELNKAGMLGANAAKRWFTDPRNGWAQDADATIRRKLGKLSGKKRQAALDRIVEQKGSTAGVVTTLVDLGEMRRALTYLVQAAGAPTPRTAAQQLEDAGE